MLQRTKCSKKLKKSYKRQRTLFTKNVASFISSTNALIMMLEDDFWRQVF